MKLTRRRCLAALSPTPGLSLACLPLTPGLSLAAETSSAASWPAAIEPVLKAQRVPGAVIALRRRQGPPEIHAFGLANLEHQVSVTAQTVFQSGSVGKQFAAVLVLLLAQDKRLSLDDRISRWASVPPAWRTMSLRHLLSHTSGLPEDYPAARLDFRVDHSDARLWRLATELPLRSAPGARWHYSNVGYVLLGLLIQRMTGRFYGDLLQERVFGPLGMRQARIIDDAAIVPHRAAGYLWQDGRWRHHEPVSPSMNRTADGSLHLDIHDLLAWDQAMRDQALLAPAWWQQAHQPVRLRGGSTAPYGLGWMLDAHGPRRRIHHDGQWQGYTSWLGWYPDEGLSVAVLTNLGDADPLAIGEAVALQALATAPPAVA